VTDFGGIVARLSCLNAVEEVSVLALGGVEAGFVGFSCFVLEAGGGALHLRAVVDVDSAGLAFEADPGAAVGADEFYASGVGVFDVELDRGVVGAFLGELAGSSNVGGAGVVAAVGPLGDVIQVAAPVGDVPAGII
jgi:hypothetical protein